MNTNRNMCVKIAKDVLKQLRLNRYVATEGTYINVTKSGDYRVWVGEPEGKQSFQKFFKENKNITCNVCALGAAFVSLVNIENKCSVADMQWHGFTQNRLAKYFGYYNLSLMESAFERSHMSYEQVRVPFDVIELAVEFGNRYNDDTQRLRAIMLNVIRNKGDFKIPVKMVKQLTK